jgi:hypothetical protein
MEKSGILLVEAKEPYNDNGIVRHIIDSKTIPNPTQGIVLTVGEGVEGVLEGDEVFFEYHNCKMVSENNLIIEKRFIKLIKRC